MIREFKIKDLERVMEIWLESNIDAHSFIDKKYWEDNYEMVKEILPSAEIYLYEENKNILGFVGLMENYIAGIFVEKNFHSQGIGRKLLDCCKSLKRELTLSVYEKNQKAYSFYIREGFQVVEKKIDENTNEIELVMYWRGD
ncbi:MAG: N-acetyltransferase [Candidatus Fusobacterium pullicola]|uniref:N-acetyltransferase n=1 Tax=Candidatus Fusobacterium pullicola TaxID=2838601 RepID=A0A9E2KYT4_9FUSO|nr:N-acetyltransferase [uncultured Fusobacterium sp.]MBU3842483.1 N-acetyltransferase [Candidatus Fusobacterium pullicola]